MNILNLCICLGCVWDGESGCHDGCDPVSMESRCQRFSHDQDACEGKEGQDDWYHTALYQLCSIPMILPHPFVPCDAQRCVWSHGDNGHRANVLKPNINGGIPWSNLIPNSDRWWWAAQYADHFCFWDAQSWPLIPNLSLLTLCVRRVPGTVQVLEAAVARDGETAILVKVDPVADLRLVDIPRALALVLDPSPNLQRNLRN